MSINKFDASRFMSESESFSIQELAELEKLTFELGSEQDKIKRKDNQSYASEEWIFKLLTTCLEHKKENVYYSHSESVKGWNDYTEQEEIIDRIYYSFYFVVGWSNISVDFGRYGCEPCNKMDLQDGLRVMFNGKSLFIFIKDETYKINLLGIGYEDLKNLYKLHIKSSIWRIVLKSQIDKIKEEITSMRIAIQDESLVGIDSDFIDLIKLKSIAHNNCAKKEIQRMGIEEKLKKVKNENRKHKLELELNASKHAERIATKTAFNTVIKEIYWKADNRDIKADKIYNKVWKLTYTKVYTNYTVRLQKDRYFPIRVLGDIYLNEDVEVKL